MSVQKRPRPIAKRSGVINGMTNNNRIDQELPTSLADRVKAEVLEIAPVIIAVHDRHHTIVWANRAYRQATGLTGNEIAGNKCYSVWGLTAPCRGCPVTVAIEHGEAVEAELTPESQEHWPDEQGSWLSKAVPIRNDEGIIIGAVETAYEITERKKEQSLLKKHAGEQALHNRIAEIFLTVDDDRMYTLVLEELLQTLESTAGLFGFLRPDDALVIPALLPLQTEPERRLANDMVLPRHQWEQTAWGRVILTHRLRLENAPPLPPSQAVFGLGATLPFPSLAGETLPV